MTGKLCVARHMLLQSARVVAGKSQSNRSVRPAGGSDVRIACVSVLLRRARRKRRCTPTAVESVVPARRAIDLNQARIVVRRSLAQVARDKRSMSCSGPCRLLSCTVYHSARVSHRRCFLTSRFSAIVLLRRNEN